MSETATNIGALSFEDGLKELEVIVKRLESGDTTLDQSIADYEKGTKLKEHCETKLKEAKLKVEKLMVNTQGDLQAEPLDDTLPF